MALVKTIKHRNCRSRMSEQLLITKNPSAQRDPGGGEGPERIVVNRLFLLNIHSNWSMLALMSWLGLVVFSFCLCGHVCV